MKGSPSARRASQVLQSGSVISAAPSPAARAASGEHMIAGGRHPELRGRDTLATLAALAEGGWIGADARADLEAAYLFLRKIEHRLQMVADDQTHTLPSEREGLERFARFAGFKDRDAFAEALVGHMRKVQSHYVRLFEDTTGRADRLALSFPKDADDRETLNRLGAHGISPAAGGLGDGAPLARRHLSRVPQRIRPHPIRRAGADRCSTGCRAPKTPMRALNAFDQFIGGLQARRAAVLAAQAEPRSGHAGGADARHRAAARRHPGAAPRGDGCAAGADILRRAAGRGQARGRPRAHVGEAQSYEDFLDRLRMFGLEQMFLVGARILSGTVSAEQAGEAFARLADVVIRALHRTGGGDVRREPRPHPRASRPRCWRSASSAAAR